jgi:flagellar basal-body rod protein FlgB
MDVFSAVSRHAEWLQQRQRVIAENVANIDTPGFKASDLIPFELGETDFHNRLLTTRKNHLDGVFGPRDAAGGSIVLTPNPDSKHSGNNVSLETEMKKVGETASALTFDTSVARLFHRMFLMSVKG